MIQGMQVLNLLACPGCRFDANSPFTVAANLAVVVMAVVLAGVLGAVLSFIWRMAKLERQALAGAAGPLRLEQEGQPEETSA